MERRKLEAIQAGGIEITVDKNGREKAYYYSMRQMRRFPLPIAEARHLIETGQAKRTDENGKQVAHLRAV